MNYKKLITNAIIQFSIIFIVVNLFLFEKLDINKINFIFTQDAFYLLLLCGFANISISIFFCLLLQIFSENRNYLQIVKIYLLGSVANQAIPGLGYIYRYQKLKHDLKISIVKYGLAQSLNNIFLLLSYLLIAIILFSFEIEFLSTWIVFLIITILIMITLFLIYRNRHILINLMKLQKIYNELINMKKKFILNKFKILLIFFFYVLQSYFQCFIFYKTVLLFEIDIGFITTSYLYIGSVLSTFLSFTNFLGAFELVLSLASSFISDHYVDMWAVGLGFRLIGLFSILIIILFIIILNKKKIYR